MKLLISNSPTNFSAHSDPGVFALSIFHPICQQASLGRLFANIFGDSVIVKNVDSFPRGNLRELVQTPELMKIGFDLHPAGDRGDKLLGSLMFNSESTNFACRIVELRLSCVGLMICSPAHGGVGIRFMAKGLLDLPG